MDKDFLKNGSKFTGSKAVGKTATEKAHVFTDSKLLHIESLLNRAHELEVLKVRRLIPKVMYTIGIFVSGLGIKGLELGKIIMAIWEGNSFAKIYQDLILPVFPYFWITIGGFLIVSLVMLVEHMRKSDFKSFINEIKDVIEGVKSKNRVNDVS